MWQLTETARMQVSHQEREGEVFVCRILTIDETGCRLCEPELQRQPRITNPTKMSTVKESEESRVYCSL
jgi:hypothetical protein